MRRSGDGWVEVKVSKGVIVIGRVKLGGGDRIVGGFVVKRSCSKASKSRSSSF